MRRVLDSRFTGKATRNAVADTITGVHLVHSDDVWAVKTNGVRGTVELFDSKSDALRKATVLAKRRHSRVFFHENPSDEIGLIVRKVIASEQ